MVAEGGVTIVCAVSDVATLTLTTSPPYVSVMAIILAKKSLRILQSSSAPSLSPSACLEVRVWVNCVNPEASANRTAPWLVEEVGSWITC